MHPELVGHRKAWAPTIRGLTQSYLLRTVLALFLFYDSGQKARMVPTFQALLALSFTALTTYERGGAFKTIHYKW